MTSPLTSSPKVRRLAWRAGRWLYTRARGEVAVNKIAINGEAYVQRCVIAAVPAGQPLRVLDIGANQGEWTLSLLGQLPADRRIAGRTHIDVFEPVPATRERLATALGEAAGREHLVRVNPLALSDAAGHFRMAVMSKTGGTNSLHYDGATRDAPPGGWVDVETMTVAAFCAGHGIERLELVKCDTEGHDAKVVAGARPMLERGLIDVLQFEYNGTWVLSRTYLKDVFDTLVGLPYRVARIMPEGIEVFEGWHIELERYFESNYLIVHERALGWFAAREGRFDASNVYS